MPNHSPIPYARSLKQIGLTAVVMLALTACQSAYYSAWEQVGVHKRDIMVDRVEDAQSSQEDAKEEFASALDEFQSLFGKPDTDLQDQYDRLSAAYEDSVAAADDVRSRIEKVESVSSALFAEWQEEINLYSDANLKKRSTDQLRQTRTRYEAMLRKMKAAEKRMDPVLAVFQDQVLFLKHNLNARAINGLQSQLDQVETDVALLIKDMEASIAESQAFIDQMQL